MSLLANGYGKACPLSEKPESKPIIRKLMAKLLKLQRSTGDKVNIKEVFGHLL